MPIESIQPIASSTGPSHAPRKKAAASPPTPPSDRVVLSGPPTGIPATRTRLEADLSMLGDANGLAINGQVRIDQPLVENMIRDAFKGNKKLVGAQISYVPGENVYVIKGKLEVTGPNLPITIKLALDVENNRLTLRFKDVEGLGPNSWYEEPVIKEFAISLRGQALRCDDFPKEKKIVFRTNDFLQATGAMPNFASLNERATQMSLSADSAGNLTFGLRATQAGPSIEPTLASDLALRLTPDGLRAALARVFAPDYKVEDLTLSAGKIDIKGHARWHGLEAGMSGLKLFGALLGDRAAFNSGLGVGKAWFPVNMSIRLTGDRLVIKPDLDDAVKPLHDSLTKRGIAHQEEKSGVSIAIQDLILGGKGHFTYLELNEQGLTAKSHLNADSFLKP